MRDIFQTLPQNGDNDQVLKPGQERQFPLMPSNPLEVPLREPELPSRTIRRDVGTPAPVPEPITVPSK